MALFGLRRNSPTSQVFWLCNTDDFDGVVGVRIDGGANESGGDTLDSSNNWTGNIEVTGLSTATHTYQMTIDGSDVADASGTFTLYASGDDFVMLFMGDTDNEVDTCLFPIITRESSGVAVFDATGVVYRDLSVAAVFGTEMFYMDSRVSIPNSGANNDGRDIYDNSPQALTDTEDLRVLVRAQYRLAYGTTETSRQDMQAKWPVYNHAGNHDVFMADSVLPDSIRYVGGNSVMFEYPSNGMPVPTGDIDTSPAITPAAYYTQVVGDVAIIVDSGMPYTNIVSRCELNGTDNFGNGRGDSKQRAWILTEIGIAAANPDINVVICSPSTIPNNTSSWKILMGEINASYSDLTVIFVVPDVHTGFIFYDMTNGSTTFPFPTISKCPTSGVTSQKLWFKNASDKYLFSDGFDNASPTLETVDEVKITYEVQDTSKFRVGRKVQLANKTGQVRKIASIDTGAGTITFDNTGGAETGPFTDASPDLPIGTLLTPIDWPQGTDIGIPGTRDQKLVEYLKMTRFGSAASPHTKFELLNSVDGAERTQSLIISDDDRFFTPIGGSTVPTSDALTLDMPLKTDDSLVVGTGTATSTTPESTLFTNAGGLLETSVEDEPRFDGAMRYLEAGESSNIMEHSDPPSTWVVGSGVTVSSGGGVPAPTVEGNNSDRLTFDSNQGSAIGDSLGFGSGSTGGTKTTEFLVNAVNATTARVRISDTGAGGGGTTTYPLGGGDFTIPEGWSLLTVTHTFLSNEGNVAIQNNEAGNTTPIDVVYGALWEFPFALTYIRNPGTNRTLKTAETLTVPITANDNIPAAVDDYSFGITIEPYMVGYAQTLWSITGEVPPRQLDLNASGKYVYTHGSTVVTSATDAQVGDRVIVTKDTVMRININTVFDAQTGTPDTVSGTASAINIGNNTGATTPYYGLLSTLNVYNEALTQEQIDNEFVTATGPPTLNTPYSSQVDNQGDVINLDLTTNWTGATSYTVTNLPSTLTASNGIVTGTLGMSGSYLVGVRACNINSDSGVEQCSDASFTWFVNAEVRQMPGGQVIEKVEAGESVVINAPGGSQISVTFPFGDTPGTGLVTQYQHIRGDGIILSQRGGFIQTFDPAANTNEGESKPTSSDYNEFQNDNTESVLIVVKPEVNLDRGA